MKCYTFYWDKGIELSGTWETEIIFQIAQNKKMGFMMNDLKLSETDIIILILFRSNCALFVACITHELINA